MYRKLATLIVYIVLSLTAATAQEICNNGIDDDADGLVDLNDPQCTCTGSSTGTPASLIPNPSFETMLCCPFQVSQVDCADQWIQASDATSDYFNECDYIAGSLPAAGLTPFPDGDGAVGMIILSDYKEYVGSCLLAPMVSGTSYTLEMDIAFLETDGGLEECLLTPTDFLPFDLTIYGAPNCGNIPYPSMDCPTAPFVPIGSISYDPLASWNTVSITFVPTFNVAEIVIGAPCTLPPGFPSLSTYQCLPYLMCDNLIINTSSSFDPFTVELSGSLCNNNAVLSASPVLTGGTWQWYEDGIALAGQTSSTLNLSALALGGGDYTATFTQTGGCVSASLEVADAEPFTITVNSETICTGSTVPLTVNGTGIATATWSPATGLSSATGTTVQASPATTTNYTVTATANGCTAQAVATVTVTAGVAITVNDEATCPGGTVVLTASGADTYTWSPATGLNTTTGPTVSATVNSTTVYTVTGTTGDCSGSGQSTVTIVNDVPMSIFATPNPATVDYPIVQFYGEPSDEELTWFFGNEGTATGSAPTHQFAAIDSTYEITLVVHTDEGCIDTARLTVVVQSGLIFYVPNTFTPDGDEHNNIFLPVFSSGYDPANFEMLIFNRWGEIVYQTKDLSAGWDGTYNGYYVPEGAYSWAISVKSDRSDERFEFQGHVMMQR
jgi:gliding motility-associated-like protein